MCRGYFKGNRVEKGMSRIRLPTRIQLACPVPASGQHKIIEL